MLGSEVALLRRLGSGIRGCHWLVGILVGSEIDVPGIVLRVLLVILGYTVYNII